MTAGARRFLVQAPSLPQPVVMAVFMETEAEPYRPQLADAQFADLTTRLAAHGHGVVAVADALRPGHPVVVRGDAAVRADLERLALASVSSPGRAVEDQVRCLAGDDLVTIVMHRPGLELVPDPELASISPDASYERYTLAPRFGLLFPRDHYADTGAGLVLANFRRRDRRAETEVVALALTNLGYRPAAILGTDEHLEGGDVQVVGDVTVVSVGMRTTPEAVRRLLDCRLVATGWLVVAHDGVRRPTEFHLDHWFGVASQSVALATEERAADPGRCGCEVYRRDGSSYRRVGSDRTLESALAAGGVKLRRIASVTSPGDLNFVALADGTVLCADRIARCVLDVLAEEGLPVEQVGFGEAHKQFGSVHCATNGLP